MQRRRTRGGLAVLGMSTAVVALAALPATAAGPTLSAPTILSFAEPFAGSAEAGGLTPTGIAVGYGMVNVPFTAVYEKAVFWKGSTPTDITPSGGTHYATCVGVSDDGTTAAGNEILASGVLQAFVRQGSTTTLLPTTLEAWGVASDGTVLLVQQGNQDTAALWHNGITTDISPTGAGGWLGTIITSKGTVVGGSQTSGSPVYLYSGGTTVTLPVPAGSTDPWPELANDSGFVEGTAQVGTATEHVLWHGSIVNKAWQGTTTVLQAPTGVGTVQSITVLGMNAAGTVVGNVINTTGAYYPVRWSAAGVPTVLSTTTQGTAVSINDSGVIVGNSSTSATTYVPTVWDGTTTLNLLKGTSYTLGAAGGINDAGKIVGWEQAPGSLVSTSHAVSWTITG